jgi:hypothetical protein
MAVIVTRARLNAAAAIVLLAVLAGGCASSGGSKKPPTGTPNPDKFLFDRTAPTASWASATRTSASTRPNRSCSRSTNSASS